MQCTFDVDNLSLNNQKIIKFVLINFSPKDTGCAQLFCKKKSTKRLKLSTNIFAINYFSFISI